MSWIETAEGARLAEAVKHLVLYILTANHATTVHKREFTRFLEDLGAHYAEPGAVDAPKPFVCRHVTFTASFPPGGELVVVIKRPLVRAGDPNLVVPHYQPYPNIIGEMVSPREWRFTVT